MAQRTILLIDYDPQNIEATTQPLVNAGYRVEVALDGLAGLEAFRRLQPDLVLIEPMVPRKHGFEVCQEIKGSDEGRSTPVLITTGFYRGRKHRLEARQYYGCDDYLERPFDEEFLLSTCGRFLAEPASEAEAGTLEGLSAALDERKEPGDELPELDNLTEEEIVARLDALIVEEPATGDAPPDGDPEARRQSEEDDIDTDFVVQAEFRQPVPTGGSAVGEPIELEAAELLEPTTEVEAEPASDGKQDSTDDAISESTVESSAEPMDEAEAESTTETTGRKEPDSAPEKRSRRPWLIAAILAGVAALAVSAIIFGPGLVGSSSSDEEQVVPPSPKSQSAGGGYSTPFRAQRGRGAAGSLPPQDRPVNLAGSIGPDIAELPLPAAELPVDVLGDQTGSPSDAATPAKTTEVVSVKPAPSKASGPKAPSTASVPSVSGTAASVPVEELDPPSTTGNPEAAVAVTSGLVPLETDPPSVPTGQNKLNDSSISSAGPQVPVESPGPKLAPGTLVLLAEVDSLPVPMNKRPPDYPPAARRMRHEGVVHLRLLVNEQGQVADVTISESDAGSLLDRAALKAARDWTYRPASKEGVPVKVWITEQVAFKR